MVKPIANRKWSCRALLWTPCILALMVSLFAPETAAIASRLMSKKTVRFFRCCVRVPPTWFIDHNDGDWISAMTAPGIGRIGFRPYWHREVPISDIGIFQVPFPETNLEKNVPLDGYTILATRSFSVGNEQLNCWDLIEHNKFVGPRPSDPSMALIKCSTDSEDLYAYFDGWRGDTATFYRIVQGLNNAR